MASGKSRRASSRRPSSRRARPQPRRHCVVVWGSFHQEIKMWDRGSPASLAQRIDCFKFMPAKNLGRAGRYGVGVRDVAFSGGWPQAACGINLRARGSGD